MKVFKEYAAYYDMLYKSKAYKEEAEFIHRVIQELHPGARTILNLGCGTGNHDFELSKLGYEVVGIDLSEEMIGIANQKKSQNKESNTKFKVGDVRNFRIEKKFDIVISLFHVMSYQSSNEDFDKALKTVKYHLSSDGLFIFDCWYGPGVLTDLPVMRHKILENDKFKIHRISKPSIKFTENVVEVLFTIIVLNKTENIFHEKEELHSMRYFFDPEIVQFCSQNSFSIHNFFDTPNVITPTNWYKMFILKNSI